MLPKQNLVSYIYIILLILLLLFSIKLFFVSLAKNSRIAAELASKCEMVSKFVEKSKMPITNESIAFLMDEQNRLKDIYQRFKQTLASPLNVEIPEEVLDSLQFKERLIQTQKRIREEAEKHNLSLPESLGFAKYETEIPEPFEIQDLMRQLKVLEALISTMTLSSIDSLKEAHFANMGAKEGKKAKIEESAKKIEGMPQTEIPAKEKGRYFDVPVSLTMVCTSAELIDFLYKLRLSPLIFVIDDLDIKKVQESSAKEIPAKDLLEASLSIRAIALQ